jgi:hypothetical protein
MNANRGRGRNSNAQGRGRGHGRGRGRGYNQNHDPGTPGNADSTRGTQQGGRGYSAQEWQHLTAAQKHQNYQGCERYATACTVASMLQPNSDDMPALTTNMTVPTQITQENHNVDSQQYTFF